MDYKRGLPSTQSFKGSKSSRNSLILSSHDSSSRLKKDNHSGAPSSLQSSIRGDENSTLCDGITDTDYSINTHTESTASRSNSLQKEKDLKDSVFKNVKSSFQEDSDGEDLFKPSNDNFFAVFLKKRHVFGTFCQSNDNFPEGQLLTRSRSLGSRDVMLVWTFWAKKFPTPSKPSTLQE